MTTPQTPSEIAKDILSNSISDFEPDNMCGEEETLIENITKALDTERQLQATLRTQLEEKEREVERLRLLYESTMKVLVEKQAELHKIRLNCMLSFGTTHPEMFKCEHEEQLLLTNGLLEKAESHAESLDDQLSAILVDRERIIKAVLKFIEDYEHQGGLISELKAVVKDWKALTQIKEVMGEKL